MRNLIALDLGITTGFAVLDQKGEFVDWGTIDYDDYESDLKHLRDRYRVSWSVAERPVIVRGSLGDRLQEVVAITSRELMAQVVLVDPSSWKQTPWSKAKPPAPKLTTHERDAARLGLWYYNTTVATLISSV